MYVPKFGELIKYARTQNMGQQVYLYMLTCQIHTAMLSYCELRKQTLRLLGSLLNEAMLENIDRLLPRDWRYNQRYQIILTRFPSVEKFFEKFEENVFVIPDSIFVDRCRKFPRSLALLPLASTTLKRNLFRQLPALRSKYYTAMPISQVQQLRKLGFTIDFIAQFPYVNMPSFANKLHNLQNERIFGLVSVNVEKYVTVLLKVLLPQNNEVVLILRDWQDEDYEKVRNKLQGSKYLCNFTHNESLFTFPCDIYYLK